MELITNFESLCKIILKKHNDTSVIMGILVADNRQSEAREYILNYLQRFDELSGKYIDFYLPGYYMYTCDSRDEWHKRQHFNICISRHCTSYDPIYLDREGSPYYFDGYLFENFLRDFEIKTGIKYTYNPMLILIETESGNSIDEIKFKNKIVIELDDNTPRGCRRSGELFETIFELAKKEAHLDRFKKGLTIKYIRGSALNTIVNVLEGNYIEALTENIEGCLKYKIK